MPARIHFLTLFALVCFAANSVLCRLALGEGAIDAASFASLRLVSGAVALVALLGATRGGRPRLGGDARAGFLLFLYAVPFSYSYLELGAGTGALILFGAVQSTMLIAALRNGERPRAAEWTGLALALAGLVILVLPGLHAPSPAGSAAMALAGVAWGLYSLRGRGARDPLADTAGNFARALPFAAAVSLATLSGIDVTPRGAALAAASGAAASGLGYVVWYAALPGLTATRASIVQLAVPVLAAAAGTALLAEAITLRFVTASAVILGGVALAVAGRMRPLRSRPEAG
jgi:drug/metabolite transporter (DMT)-like permease